MAQMQIGLGNYQLDNVPNEITSGTNSKYGAVVAVHFVSDKAMTGPTQISYNGTSSKSVGLGSDGTIAGSNIPKVDSSATKSDDNIYRQELLGTDATSSQITNFLVGSSGNGSDSMIYKIDNNSDVGWRELSGTNVSPSTDPNAVAADGTNLYHYLFVGPISEKGGVNNKTGVSDITISSTQSNNFSIVGTRRIVVKRNCWDGSTSYVTVISDNYYPIGTSGIFENRYEC